MPELPEVELFRRLLLPLASASSTLSLEIISDNPPKSFITKEDVKEINNNTRVVDVQRKGKLICMVLDCVKKIRDQDRLYLFLHMGMTGRISTPSYVPKLVEQPSQDYPPKYTHIRFRSGENEACFSDPRKFGHVLLFTCQSEKFGGLAEDALTLKNVQGLINQRLGIKAILLDQKRVLSGVGNWVADEVLYQSHMHPEQKYLQEKQAQALLSKLKDILTTAIQCLDADNELPSSWLFHVRWNKRSASSGSIVKDDKGRKVAFITAGGRTSALVPSIQKLITVAATKKIKKTSAIVQSTAAVAKGVVKPEKLDKDVLNAQPNRKIKRTRGASNSTHVVGARRSSRTKGGPASDCL